MGDKNSKSAKTSNRPKKKAKSESNYEDADGGADIGCMPKKIKKIKEQSSARLSKKKNVEASTKTSKSRRLKTAKQSTATTVSKTKSAPSQDEAPTQTASKLLPPSKNEPSRKAPRSVRRVKTDSSVPKKSSPKSVAKPIASRTPKTDPVECTAKSIKKTSEDADERTMTESIKRSFRKIRKKSMDAFTKVKVIMSRPIKEKNMLKLLDRVNKREKSDSEKLKPGDEVFPHVKPRSKCKPAVGETPVEVEAKKKDKSTKKDEPKKEEEPKQQQKSVIESATQTDATKSVATTPETEDNIMIDGRPFWQQRKKGEQKIEFDPDEVTDDELPLSANVLTEVFQNKIQLVTIPKTKLKLDPYAKKLEHFKDHDSLFTKEIIFSNTVRTMVNVIDDQDSNSCYQRETVDKPKTVEEQKPVTIDEPEMIWRYDTKDPTVGGVAEERLQPKDKKDD